MNTSSDHREEVVRLLMENRTSLLAYIFTCLRNHDAAEDILQEVAVTVCEDANSFTLGTNFRAWAREIARRRIAAHWRSKKNAIILSSEELDRVTNGFEQHDIESDADERIRAIRLCLAKLKPFSQKIFQLRYTNRLNLEQIAKLVGRKSESVRKGLYRGRIALRSCVERQVETGPDTQSWMTHNE